MKLKSLIIIPFICLLAAQPLPPQNLTIESQLGALFLQWEEPLDTFVSYYNIYRDGFLYDSVDYTNYYDDWVIHDVQYCYSVTCVNNEGESDQSNTVCDSWSYAPPMHLRAVSTNHSILLTWEPPYEPNGPLFCYEVYRDGTLLAVLEPWVTSYEDGYPELEPGTEYCYFLTTMYDEGMSQPTEEVCAAWNLPAPTNFTINYTMNGLHLQWDQSLHPEFVFIENLIYRNDDFYSATNDGFYFDTDLEYGNSYCFSVSALFDIGESQQSESICIDFQLNPPANINAVSEDDHILLTWDTPEPFYGWYQGVFIFRDGLFLDFVEEYLTTYSDFQVGDGNQFCYTLEAVYDQGTSELTEEICLYHNPQYGCTDPEALNYDPEAVVDDGSCLYGVALSVGEVDSDSHTIEIVMKNTESVGLFQFFITGFLIERISGGRAEDAGFTESACSPWGNIQPWHPGDPDIYIPLGNGPLSYIHYSEIISGVLTFQNAEFMEYEGPAINTYYRDGDDYIPIPAGGYSMCTDQEACNYNPLSVLDDGCEYAMCRGCTDPTALNYSPIPTFDNGSCDYIEYSGPVWHVATDGSDVTGDGSVEAPYASIQRGINFSSEGDTVLVQPGTYIENIDFHGHNITLGSMFIMTGDTSYISQTVIDGNQNDHVVTFRENEDSTAVIKGFTVQNGEDTYGGGIFCIGANPTISNSRITNNRGLRKGGGMYCGTNTNPTVENSSFTNNEADEGGAIYCGDGSYPNLISVTITENTADSGGGVYCYQAGPDLTGGIITNNQAQEGGGIYCYGNSNPTLENVLIVGNSADNGGGLYCTYESQPVLDNVTVSGNSATEGGGGIYCRDDAIVIFSAENRCSIFSNNVNNRGSGAELFSETAFEVIVDTFTVMIPTDYHASPIENFSFDILHAIQGQINADLYVSPDGDNANDGLTSDTPFKTIQHALSIILTDNENPHTITLLNGLYSPSTNGEFFPVDVVNEVSIIGESEAGVILDAENQAGVMRIIDVDHATVSHLTLTGGYNTKGGGIYCMHSEPNLENLTIVNNYAKYGGGIGCIEADPLLENIMITGNSADLGGGVYVVYSPNLGLNNVSIIGNSASSGAGMMISSSSNPVLNGVMISGNSADVSGGGISCSSSNMSLTDVTITGNSANNWGGGLICGTNSILTFSADNRCSIFSNNVINRSIGADIYSDSPIDVVVDAFTVMDPTDYHASPIGNFSFDILQAIQEQVAADLYVSPDGDNTNDGLTPESPLKTIQHALSIILADSENPHTITLSNGIYSSSTNGEFFPVDVTNHVSIVGESEAGVILDAENQTSVMRIVNVDHATVSQLTITGGLEWYGGGIYCGASGPNLVNISIIGNSSSHFGGGMYCSENSSPVLTDVTISDNSAEADGGGIYCTESNPILTNTTMVNNSAVDGGGIYCDNESAAILENVILSGNSAIYVGGGIYCDDNSNMMLHDVTVTGNTANHKGGGLSIMDSNPDLLSVVLTDNTADDGGGIYCYRSSPILINVVISNNLDGGGLYCSEGSSPILEDVTIADNVGSGIRCTDNSNPELTEVTISGNTGSRGGGLYCHDSSPSLNNVSISGNFAAGEGAYGGGLYCYDSNPTLVNVEIIGNYAGDDGGGIHCYGSAPSMTEVTVSGNTAGSSGGGMYCDYNSPVNLTNVTITGNSAIAENGFGGFGGGICFIQTNPSLTDVTITDNLAFLRGGGIYAFNTFDLGFSNENRCNIYSNVVQSRGRGADIYSTESISVAVDTFSVMIPTDFHASPIDSFTFDIWNAITDQTDADLFVSPDGDNSNDGLSLETPLETIHQALNIIFADSANQKTITLANGVYSPSSNGEFFPLDIVEYVSIVGESRSGVILDAENNSGVIIIDEVNHSEISNLTVTGGLTDEGGGIHCRLSTVALSDISIIGNAATGEHHGRGGGIFSNYSDLSLTRVVIANNSATTEGGGMYSNSSNIEMTQVTIAGNTAVTDGGGVFAYDISSIILTNSILWNDFPTEVSFYEYYPENYLTVAYSDIMGGESGIITTGYDEIFWLEGNLDQDPLFVNPAIGDFHLQPESPCIDAGDPDSPLDPDGTIADMGAFYHHHVQVDNPVHFDYILNGQLEDYQNFADTSGYSVESHIIIETIDNADVGDEIGLLDYNGMINFGNCDEHYGEILVGAGVWQGEPLDITAYGSMDFCSNPEVEYGQYPGWVEGNPIYILYWRSSDNQLYSGDYDGESGVLTWSPLDQTIPLLVPTPQTPYDVNSDFSTDILDVVIVLDYILGYLELTDDQFMSVDTNYDGHIDILDIVMMIEYILES